MKNLWITFVLLFSFACSKDDGFVNATVNGYDLRLCACCGGLLIETEVGQTYQWYPENEQFDITSKTTFPLRVKIKFHHLVSPCAASDGIIEVTDLERI